MIRTPDPIAGGVRLPRLYPRQGHPGGRPPPHPPAGPAGRPPVRQHRAPVLQSLALLAPDKKTDAIFQPMAQIKQEILQSKAERQKFRHAPAFAPAGQSTQMIVGASDETDYHILKLSEGMYRKYGLKRVFFSAYVPVTHSPLLPPPVLPAAPAAGAPAVPGRLAASILPLPGRRASLPPDHPTLNPQLDPKCSWAMSHLEYFPVEGNTADYHTLLRVLGIRVVSARRILSARRWRSLDHTALGKLGVVLKRAQYFITCSGKMTPALRVTPGRGPAGPDPPGGPRSARALRTALPFSPPERRF